jgi:hypothetical protein
MQKGGPELEEYLDLQGRITTARSLNTRIQNQYAGEKEIFDQVAALTEKHGKEWQELDAALAAAKKKLAAAGDRLAALSR